MTHLLIGYGTLLLRSSLGRTIGRSSAQSKRVRPVWVMGHRRLFNLRPTHYVSTTKLSSKGNEDAAMNIEPAVDTRLNALAFEVSQEELRALDERERYYRRVSVQICDFDDGEPLGTGEAYISNPDAPWIERDPERLMPNWRDIVWSRRGSYELSDHFGLAWDETTYLADGLTLVVERYCAQLLDMSDIRDPD